MGSEIGKGGRELYVGVLLLLDFANCPVKIPRPWLSRFQHDLNSCRVTKNSEYVNTVTHTVLPNWL